ncbi:methylglyoxal reductase (NADPH-dependent) gre2 [Tulasnella sp. JGI-2019a]|nr:methylglyoxal reductase (NADPH-dependent) gre2 [Tulasnella sp. JGI-2019a]
MDDIQIVSISVPATVLVTGASGFLATFCCQSLLRRGFNVRGTVRSQAKGEYLKKLSENEPNGKFEYIIVEDIQAPNAFDEAVKSVDAVEHVASPLTGFGGEPEQVLKPAIQGTIGILESVKKNGPGVKRIVITSSSGAVSGMKDTTWNQAAVDEVEKKGKAAPDMIGGPNIQEGGISASNMYLLGPVDPNNRKTGDELTMRKRSCCDVRDIADIHTELLMASKAGGERILAAPGWSSHIV